MIQTVVILGILCVAAFPFSQLCVNGVLVDSSTVRVNYYKNLYTSDSRRMIECKLAMFADLEEAAKSCNESDSELVVQQTGSAQMRPLVGRSQTSVVRAKSRNLSHENDLTIRLENVTIIQENSSSAEDYVVIAAFKEKKKSSFQEKELLRSLAQRVLKLQQQPLLTHIGDSVSGQCRQEAHRYLEALRNFELWAVQMFDAGAKIPSGILNGNVNQYGDFDQCLGAKEELSQNSWFQSRKEKIQGKYCLAYLQPTLPEDNDISTLKYLYDRVQSYGAFRSNFDDPGHRVPRFSTINWALCVPSGCSNTDVEILLRESLSNFTQGLQFNVKVRVEEDMCQVYQSPLAKVDDPTIYAAIFFGFILIMSLGMTIYDHVVPDSEAKNEWLTTFSLKKNVASLVSLKREGSDIPSVHGIRFVNAIMLIVAHKSMALFFQPYANRTEMSETVGKSWTVIGRAASLYTDPFIMLSGLLTTYSLYGRLQRGQSFSIAKEYFSRLLRIVPTLGALILFCTFILPLLGSGPQWNLVVTHHATICKSYWWRNLLFIHNYFGFENMCLTHTHHVGIDTQLFLLAPLFTIALFRWPKRTLQVILALATISTIARYYVTVSRNLSNYVFFGTTVTQLFDTANHMYILPAHRLTVYVMGVCLAFILRHSKGMQLTGKQLKLGWYVNVLLFVASFFGPAPMGDKDYVYNSTHAAHYAAFAPIGYCSFFAWVIFTHHLGHQSWLSRVFSAKWFMVTTRLSYAIYLTQFPVFFFNVGKTRSSEYYDFIRMTLNWNELFWIILTSVILTLFFDTPFGNIKKLLFKSKKPQVKLLENKTVNEEKEERKDAVTDCTAKKEVKGM